MVAAFAIDPKGVVGELAYETGAALRNPCDRPELFAAPATIPRQVDCFACVLRLDGRRILAWAFAQAILAPARVSSCNSQPVLHRISGADDSVGAQ
jgi:streptomycin 6-kinase